MIKRVKDSLGFVICFMLFFIITLNKDSDNSKKESYKLEIKEKKEWFHSEMDDIATFLKQKKSILFY